MNAADFARQSDPERNTQFRRGRDWPAEEPKPQGTTDPLRVPLAQLIGGWLERR